MDVNCSIDPDLILGFPPDASSVKSCERHFLNSSNILRRCGDVISSKKPKQNRPMVPTYPFQPQHGFVFPSSQGQWQPSDMTGMSSYPSSSSMAASCSLPTATSTSKPSQTQTKQASKRTKSIDWTEDETKELIEAWRARYSRLRSASNKDKTKIWNEIYTKFQQCFSKNERTLPQVKKRVQNLEYEYKNAKEKSQRTGEEGIKYIKEKFPFFDLMDDVMGHRDIADIKNMEIESSSVFTDSPESSESSLTRSITPSTEAETDGNEDDQAETPVSSKGKRGKGEKGKGKKNKRRKLDDSEDDEWQERFFNVMEKGMEEDSKRLESCLKAFQESQTRQAEQTNNILAGFKGIFTDLLSKKD
ncbi:hypothetical protein AC249_AIPGENE22117 [Exaiptasia diaphana]|nr:hypothetical protein AC249_AIPGENE22117 [Exaiptasia diaphana]